MKNNKVVLDSSALLAISEFRIDLFQKIREEIEGDVEYYIPSPIYEELNMLAKNKGKKGIKAKTALLLLEKYKSKINIIPSKGIPDKSVVMLARLIGGYVTTSDKKIKESSLKKGLRVIIIRGKKIEVL